VEFDEIVMQRYATKLFDGKKIPEEKVNKLLELIRFAPSSFNIQPWKIKVIADAALKQKVQAVAYNQPSITSSSHLLVFCADTNIDHNINEIETQMKKLGASKEQLEPYFGMMRGFASGLSQEQRLAWAQRQLYLALGNALNGAKSLGFDSCPMEGFDPKACAEILQLPANLVPTALCPIGYAADKQNQKARLSKDAIFF